MDSLIASRAQHSRSKLDELARRLAKIPEPATYPGLTIYAVGSYGRQEASKYSDLDLFFLTTTPKTEIVDPNTRRLRLFGQIIEIADDMGFPKFSNDSEFLVILDAKDLLDKLGSRTDDLENYFTARMLLLLEGQCLYGDATHGEFMKQVVESYFRDYHDHPNTFEPTFLLNDICRFWKTMLLNYENKRNIPAGGGDPATQKVRQKVRNFKLKYSRMTTCFASIAVLGSHAPGLSQEDVIRFTTLTPRERILAVLDRVPEAKDVVKDLEEKYGWFLEMTGLPTEQLERTFEDKKQVHQMFQRAVEYGDAMYRLLQVVDQQRAGLLRTLVI
jgi:predicted nucleotidyltransferase